MKEILPISPYPSIHIACKGGFFLPRFRYRLPRRRGPLPLRYVVLFSFLFFILFTIIGLIIIHNGLKPTLMAYATSKTQQIALSVIDHAIIKTKTVDIQQVITIDSTTGFANINTEKILEKRAELSKRILENIKLAEEGEIENLQIINDVEVDFEKTKEQEGITFSVPLGKVTDHALLGNLGPKIPIHFQSIGHLESDILTDFQQVGINNIYVEISMTVNVTMQVIIPFASEKVHIEQKIPLALGVIKGDVPQFYNLGGITPPALQLPID